MKSRIAVVVLQLNHIRRLSLGPRRNRFSSCRFLVAGCVISTLSSLICYADAVKAMRWLFFSSQAHNLSHELKSEASFGEGVRFRFFVAASSTKFEPMKDLAKRRCVNVTFILATATASGVWESGTLHVWKMLFRREQEIRVRSRFSFGPKIRIYAVLRENSSWIAMASAI